MLTTSTSAYQAGDLIHITQGAGSGKHGKILKIDSPSTMTVYWYKPWQWAIIKAWMDFKRWVWKKFFE